MTTVTRSLPCSDLASTLPWDALDWANRANAEVAALWANSTQRLSSIAGSNTITAACNPVALGAYAAGQEFELIPAGTSTGAVTLNIDSKGAVSVLDRDGNALTSSNCLIAGRLYKVRYVSGNFRVTTDVTAAGIASWPYGYIAGLILSNDAGDVNNYIGISVGAARDQSNAQNITVGAAFVKRLNAAWAAGSNAGGILTGSKAASTKYGVFLLRKDADGSGDVGFYPGASPVGFLPTGYSTWRRIGWIITDGSNNIRQFFQDKEIFRLKTKIAETVPGTPGTITSGGPPSVELHLEALVGGTGGSGVFSISFRETTVTAGQERMAAYADASVNNAQAACPDCPVSTNSSSQYVYAGSSNGTTVNVVGWIDTRMN